MVAEKRKRALDTGNSRCRDTETRSGMFLELEFQCDWRLKCEEESF